MSRNSCTTKQWKQQKRKASGWLIIYLVFWFSTLIHIDYEHYSNLDKYFKISLRICLIHNVRSRVLAVVRACFLSLEDNEDEEVKERDKLLSTPPSKVPFSNSLLFGVVIFRDKFKSKSWILDSKVFLFNVSWASWLIFQLFCGELLMLLKHLSWSVPDLSGNWVVKAELVDLLGLVCVCQDPWKDWTSFEVWWVDLPEAASPLKQKSAIWELKLSGLLL